MTAQDDRTWELQALLPQGEPWETEDGEALYALLRSLAGEPARITAAGEQHLADFMPDTCGDSGTYIPDWARVLGLPEAFESDAWDSYTDAQKQAVIIAKLQVRADPNLPNLEQGFRDLFGDQTITLTHREHAPFECGVSGCGEGVGAAFQGVWTLRYMTSRLAYTPNDFANWTRVTGGSISTSAATVPYGAQTLDADQVDLAGAVVSMYAPINSTADGDDLRASIWLRIAPSGSEIETVQIRLRQRDGATYDPAVTQTVTVKNSLWQKYVINGSAGAGAFSPRLEVGVWTPSTAVDLQLAGAFAGIRNITLEQRAQTLAPFVTVGEFLVNGEDQEI